MRNQMKFLIGCAILAGTGAVCSAIGAMSGGIINGIRLDKAGLHVYSPSLANEERQVMYKKGEKQVEAFESIEVDVEYADVSIGVSESGRYEVSYGTVSDSSFLCGVEGHKLVVKNKESGQFHNFALFSIGNVGFGSMYEEEYVKIRVPEGTKLSGIQIKSDSGDAVCGKLVAGDIKIDAEYGDITLEDLQAGDMEMSMSSGEMQISGVKGKSCKVKNEYGNASFKDLELSGDMEVEAESGDTYMENVSAKGLKQNSAYGKITVKQSVFQEIAIQAESGDCGLDNVAFGECGIDSEYGSVDVKLAKQITDYSYKLKTEYGGIKVGGEKMGESFYSLEKGQENAISITCESGDISIE